MFLYRPDSGERVQVLDSGWFGSSGPESHHLHVDIVLPTLVTTKNESSIVK